MVGVDKQHAGGHLQSFRTEEGRLEVVVRDGLPACLLAANEALCRGNPQGARRHLGESQIEEVRALLESDPGRTDVMFIVAKLFFDLQDLEQAEYWFRRVLEREAPAEVYGYLSEMLFRNEYRWTEAVHYSRLAHEAAPDNPMFHVCWAQGLVRSGSLQEGLSELQEAMKRYPDLPGDVYTTYLWYHQYLPEMSSARISAGYRDWARRFAPPEKARRSHRNDRDPDRRIRVGYLSPDFRRNAVNAFFEPVLDGHDRRQVEVFGYGNVRSPDRTTARLAAKFDAYRDIVNLDGPSIATLIERDDIDVLVEIGGHVLDSRMDVLALRPAPIQVDFGGISTTGMPQVDYRVTDAVYDPQETCGHYVEACVHLPGGLSSFRPPSDSPDVASLPARRNGFFTFGSLNGHLKISPFVLDMWIRILQEMPSSRMVLKFYAAADAEIRAELLRRFEARGIAPDRIRILGMVPYTDHLRLLNQIDMLLDTFPYNGGTTTMDGLWMGVPALTLTGERFVSRAGLSILTRVGLEAFAARTPEEYVQKAKSFATQTEALERIRAALRPMMLHSSLCRRDRSAGELECAYRQMWRRWCLAAGG